MPLDRVEIINPLKKLLLLNGKYFTPIFVNISAISFELPEVLFDEANTLVYSFDNFSISYCPSNIFYQNLLIDIYLYN